jgi:pSer/pThr/pTyr-binding forkhead associated (FHA) protein
VLLARVAFAAILYLFLFRLVEAVRHDLRRPEQPPRRAETRAALEPGGALIVVDGADVLASGSVVKLTDNFTIGRASDNDLALEDPLVSGQHARIWRQGKQWVLADLGSTNGTLVNDQPVEQDLPLQPGDLISIGSARFRLGR